MKVISHIPGRIRIRSEILKKENQCGCFAKCIGSLEDIESLSANGTTGSILVLYDETVNMHEMLVRLEEMWKECFNAMPEVVSDKLKQVNRRHHIRSFLNIGMITTLTGTVASVYLFHSKRWHIYYGTAMTGLILGHMQINRKPLKRSLNILNK